MTTNPRHPTGRLRLAVLVCTFATLALDPAPAVARQSPPADSAPIRIVCHFECGGIAEDAARVAAAAWPLADALFGASPAPRGRAPEIHLYRSPAAYVAARSGLFRPLPTGLAATEPHARRAHIAIPDGVADTTLAAFGLPGTVLRVVAHEAYHLAALARAPGSARLPEWLVEGAASWAEHEALRAAGRVGEAEQEPVASTYQWLVRQRLRAGHLPRAADILADRLPGFDEQERYAVRKLFFEYLLASPYAATLDAAVLAAATYAERRSLLRRLPRPAAIRRTLDRALLGPAPAARLDSIDRGFRMHVDALRPAWVQTGRALDGLGADDWLHVGVADDASAWRLRLATTVRLSGKARFLTGGVAQVLIDSNGSRHFAVSFDRDRARLSVEQTDGGSSVRIHDAPLTSAADDALHFDIVARYGTLEIRIDGGELLTLELAGLEPNGGWGVGVSRGANVVWSALSDRP